MAVEVIIHRDPEQGIRELKKKMQREGVYKSMKMRRHYESPSEKKVRIGQETARRIRKNNRRRRLEG